MTDLAPMCGTCGSAFTCFNGALPVASAWYDCTHVCAMCSGSLEDGRAVMEHPGLGSVIHLACCPVPADDDLLAQA